MFIHQYFSKILEDVGKRGRVRRPLVWLVQLCVFAAAGLAAFLLRFDFDIPSQQIAQLWLALPVWCFAKSVVFRAAKLDSGWWSFVSIADVSRIAAANCVSSIICALAILAVAGTSFPRSIFLLDLIICVLFTAGVRVLFRLLTEMALRAGRDGTEKRTLIYGAGNAGDFLLRELHADTTPMYRVVGFADDDPRKMNYTVQGLPVLGSGTQLAELVRKYRIEEILIALPTASGRQMTQVLQHCFASGVPYKTVPSLTEVLKGQGMAKQIRSVAVEDLLGRQPVSLDTGSISDRIRGKVVLVTGAGGSIGSELCRQLTAFEPKAIVGYDLSENALFHLDLEMRERYPHVVFMPRIGSVQNASRLSEVLEQCKPSLLYHAAAYKHVPLMESHIAEAVENNILGTATAARLAAEHGLEEFVMVSTDKAVRPTSLMGATKRAAELVVNSFNGGRTNYVSVRFGNVLGSNGSVIPLFKQQIAAGGPVKVTHPDMQRYFMTIPEASQLVLQASAMGRGGEIFVLDMGQPVRILDLAKNLIILSGLRPDEDIKIEFTGLRPGEKLYEELSSMDERTVATAHEKIAVFRGPEVSASHVAGSLRVLRDGCLSRDICTLVLQLKEMVPEYNPSSHLLRQVITTPEETSHSLAALAMGVGFIDPKGPKSEHRSGKPANISLVPVR